ncbi:flavo protein NADH-dependent oxidoreductase [Coprinopsis marcescibilis]|uniref:Flavo protein NADH-dependent oxidoreductase n=1 Tax=Coprinopsis marcescibilis TaxID=230819 RepID=A0A5C3KEH9_COPMA|nr:flavo protein NADH-dependent oxidoreductase [Coprinopsis marcescibilis]
MSSTLASAVSNLFEPLQLGSITVQNRIQMAALTRNRAPNAVPTDLMREHYAQRARGGTGLIVAEAILIIRQGTEWAEAPGIWSCEQVAAWKKITDAVHAEGSHIYAQLWHLGRVSHPEAPQQKLAGTPVYAPSAISARGGKFRFIPGQPGYTTPTEIEDPTLLIEQFRLAAINAKEAGFDGVELHGANGYLIAQFLDSGANQRTDKWGGSVENRSRFGLEVLKVFKSVFGANVAVKLSYAGGYNDVGMPLPETIETFTYFISEADKLGLSYFALVRYVARLDITLDGKLRAIQHDVLETYRPYIKNAKLYLNGEVSGEEGAKLVEEGKIDGVSIGLLYVTHPDVGNRIRDGKPLDNVPNFPAMQIGGDDETRWYIGYNDYPAAS